MTEQQRIEEYAGKRALLRLEQELADHSEAHAPTGDNSEIIKSVMDRKKTRARAASQKIRPHHRRILGKGKLLRRLRGHVDFAPTTTEFTQ